eukprot:scaffold6013_cov210-Isochrysis_galbana.AAC.2
MKSGRGVEGVMSSQGLMQPTHSRTNEADGRAAGRKCLTVSAPRAFLAGSRPPRRAPWLACLCSD